MLVMILLMVLQVLCMVAGWCGIIHGLKHDDYLVYILGVSCSLVSMVGLVCIIVMAI